MLLKLAISGRGEEELVQIFVSTRGSGCT